jgi:hypothetical protein
MPQKLCMLGWMCLLAGLITGLVQAAEVTTDWGTLEIHGFLSQGYLKSFDNNVFAGTRDGTFQFNEVGLNVNTDLTDRLHAGIQFFARDLGKFGNNTVDIDWAYADYRWKDWLGARLGRLKVPYGLYNETRDLDMLRVPIFLPQGLYGEVMRDISLAGQGGGLYGYLPGGLNYAILLMETSIENDDSMAQYMEEQAHAKLMGVEASALWSGQIEWNLPFEGLRLSASMQRFDLHLLYQITEETPWAQDWLPVGTEFKYHLNDMTSVNLALEYTSGRFLFATEYEYEEVEVSNDFDQASHEKQGSYYGAVAYRLTDWLEIGTYYHVYYPNLDDRNGETLEAQKYRAWQKDTALTLRLDFNDHWTMKLEGHAINGAALFFARDNPDGVKEESYLLALKTTYNF